MRHTLKLSILLLGIIFLNGKCIPEKENIFVKKMVEFDKAFVPVLYYVYQGDILNAKSSVFYLEHKWQQFYQRYSEANSKSRTWNDNFCLMNQWLDDAVITIDKGHQMNALIQLNNVRHQMKDMRKELEIDYYLDYVWDFEAPLDLTAQIATNPFLLWSSYDEFESIVVQLNTRWEILRSQQFPDVQYEMDAKTQKEYLLQMNYMDEVLQTFNQIIEEKRENEFEYTSKILIRGYFNMLYNFGFFQNSKAKYVLNKNTL